MSSIEGFIPEFTQIVLSKALCENQLIDGKYYFTIPRGLLNSVIQQIGNESFDPQILDLEYSLLDLIDKHPTLIGFWNAVALPFHLLRSTPWSSVVIDTAQSESRVADPKSAIALLQQRSERMLADARGYLGWLLTNPVFVQEHDTLFEEHTESFEQGIPQPAPVVPNGIELPLEWQMGKETPTTAAVQKFCQRWRLERLLGPYIPVPLQPQFPVLDPRSAARYAQAGGMLIFIPDTFPIRSRDDLPHIIEDAIRGAGVPEHLSEWSELASSGNSAKNSIDRYGRLFELQHYCRALYARHSEALNRQRTRLELALAEFLGIGEDSVHKDLGGIRDRLGDNWAMSNVSLVGSAGGSSESRDN